MKVKLIAITIVTLIITVSGSAQEAAEAKKPNYIASALIEVLPYVDRDPLAIESPPVDKDLQNEFRNSMAALMTQRNFMIKIFDREKIRNSNWFKSRGSDAKRAIGDLFENYGVSVQDDNTCLDVYAYTSDPNDSVLIVSEAVTFFIEMREFAEKARIETKLNLLEKRKDQVQKELDSAEKGMEEAGKRWGFTDLEEHRYRHPVEERLIRLEQNRDDLVLAIGELESRIMSLNSRNKDIKDAQEELRILQMKLRDIEKLYAEAVEKKKNLDQARTQYRQLSADKERKQKLYDQIDLLIEKLILLRNDPEVSKLKVIVPAGIVDVEEN